MPLRLIHSGSRSNFRPLGSDGVAVLGIAEQLRSVVSRRLGPDAADLLASPRLSESGDRIDWHTSRLGPVVRFTSADADERAAALAILETEKFRFQTLASELSNGGRDQKAYARQLSVALHYPGEDCLYLVGGKPVLAFWGFASLAAATVNALEAAPPPPPPSPQLPVPSPAAPLKRSPLWLAPLLAPLLLLGYCHIPATDQTCDPAASAGPAGRVVVLLDTSRSMGLPLDGDAEELSRLSEAANGGDPAAQRHLMALMGTTSREDSRLGAAMDALSVLINDLPTTTDIGLTTFGQCGAPRNRGVFAGSGRAELRTLVQGLELENGTPLAAGLEAAADLMRGQQSPVLTVISDGEESCGGDPCEVARRLRTEMPDLVINVVDLSGLAVAACLADETGGQVYSPANVGDLRLLLKRASAACPSTTSRPNQ